MWIIAQLSSHVTRPLWKETELIYRYCINDNKTKSASAGIWIKHCLAQKWKIMRQMHLPLRARLHGEFQPGQPGWNFVAITWWTSARTEIFSLGTKYEIPREESRENQAAILFPAFQPGLKFRPRLKKSPCNRQFDFKRICFRSRAEVWNSPCNRALSYLASHAQLIL